ncbi:YqzE family protein [Rossellomorea vietnamensis]|uniref:YqzE family protein n=1 Tax=Rossellomorea vietnamensis TaxID=218284 RepID=A0A5D4NK66_9BACI|nr:YqzE family protein [Rossellomorea vietnamensis]TYS14249.1 YqzE family protein [Rossellomorea vietnamensis]
MSINDYVKYMTQTAVRHFEKTPQERKSIKELRKTEKQSFLFRWFGVIPYALMFFFKKK